MQLKHSQADMMPLVSHFSFNFEELPIYEPQIRLIGEAMAPGLALAPATSQVWGLFPPLLLLGIGEVFHPIPRAICTVHILGSSLKL